MNIYDARIPKKEKYINNIEIENIDRIDTAQFFDVITEKNIMINNILIQICKEVLIESYNKGGKEAGAIINIDTGQHAIHEATKYGSVDFDEDTKAEYYKIHQDSEANSCIIIHNHNTKESFSRQDVLSLLGDKSAAAIIVITCNENIFILVKEDNVDYSEIKASLDINYKTDFITTDTRRLMKKNNLIERRVTTWEITQ